MSSGFAGPDSPEKDSKAPAEEAPAADAPAVDAPAVDAPAVEPAADAPAADAAVADAAAADAPADVPADAPAAGDAPEAEAPAEATAPAAPATDVVADAVEAAPAPDDQAQAPADIPAAAGDVPAESRGPAADDGPGVDEGDQPVPGDDAAAGEPPAEDATAPEPDSPPAAEEPLAAPGDEGTLDVAYVSPDATQEAPGLLQELLGENADPALPPDPEAQAAAEQVLQTVLQARQQITDALRAVGDSVKAEALHAQVACLEGYAGELRKFLSTGESALGAGLDDAFDPLRLDRGSSYQNPEVQYMVQDLNDMPMPRGGLPASPSASSLHGEEDPPAEATYEATCQEEQADLDRVRRVRRQIVAYKTGQDVNAASADVPLFDETEFDDNIDELRRVRRQIRYLFGAAPMTVPAVYMPSQPMPTYSEPIAAVHSHVPMEAPVDLPPLISPKGVPTPRSAKSGGSERSYTDSRYSVSGSSEEPRRRRHRHRDRDRDRDRDRTRERDRDRDRDAARRTPKDDEWAQEVIKASLDPKNQWDFGDTWGSNSRKQPRQGSREKANGRGPPGVFDASDPGEQVFRKAQQRAEEVLRQERERGY